MTEAFRFSNPQRIPSPDDAKLWSITSVERLDSDDDFRFLCCRKLEDGSILTLGQADTLVEATQLKKELSKELNCLIFLKAKKIERVELVDYSDAQLDRFRDWYNEGVGLADVDRPLRAGYLAFLRDRRSAR